MLFWIDYLFLYVLGFKAILADTGRLGCYSFTWFKLLVYEYLNRIQSSRELEREADRNIVLIWLLGRLGPDFKSTADCTKDNGKVVKTTCRELFGLCR